jgi:hypothetical protein
MNDHVDALDWAALIGEVDAASSAQTAAVLTPAGCREISAASTTPAASS